MSLILVRIMQIECAWKSGQVSHKAIARFMDLPTLSCMFNLHEPHQSKDHSLIWTTVSAYQTKQFETIIRDKLIQATRTCTELLSKALVTTSVFVLVIKSALAQKQQWTDKVCFTVLFIFMYILYYCEIFFIH